MELDLREAFDQGFGPEPAHRPVSSGSRRDTAPYAVAPGRTVLTCRRDGRGQISDAETVAALMLALTHLGRVH